MDFPPHSAASYVWLYLCRFSFCTRLCDCDGISGPTNFQGIRINYLHRYPSSLDYPFIQTVHQLSTFLPITPQTTIPSFIGSLTWSLSIRSFTRQHQRVKIS